MQILSLTQENARAVVTRAAEVLVSGGVVLYPTDTLYGLGVDAFSDEAVAKIYEIKSRDTNNPMSVLVSSMDMAERYAEITHTARTLADNFLPGPLTLILDKKPAWETGVGLETETIGLRIPQNAFCIAMAHLFDGGITATSANRSGQLPEMTLGLILAQLGSAIELVDLVIDAGDPLSGAPSTVVDARTSKPRILREGVISETALLKAFAG